MRVWTRAGVRLKQLAVAELRVVGHDHHSSIAEAMDSVTALPRDASSGRGTHPILSCLLHPSRTSSDEESGASEESRHSAPRCVGVMLCAGTSSQREPGLTRIGEAGQVKVLPSPREEPRGDAHLVGPARSPRRMRARYADRRASARRAGRVATASSAATASASSSVIAPRSS